MKILRKLAALAAIISTPGAALAQANCLSNDEAETVVTAMLPSVLEAMHRQCSPYLAPEAALRSRGLDLAAQYSSTTINSRSEAARIAYRIITNSESEQLEDISEATVLDVFEVAATGALAGSLDEDACATADRFYGILEPLPAANVAGLTVLLMEIGMRDDEPGQGVPFRLCDAAAG
ncbi:MAG: hypothetical protein HKN78_12290 [Sphingomonadaceae bacterium]|nr:hypothetical protein [Sphingomonadaceae bacterium]